MKPIFLGLSALCFFSICPAGAQPAAPAKSPWCEKFDHTSLDVWRKSLVIQTRDPATGQVADAQITEQFKLTATLRSMLAVAKSEQTPEDLIGTMIESLRAAEGEERQPKSELRMSVSARAGEARLTPQNLLADSGPDAMFPVGLFNRFDLTSTEGGNCGEARIVYAKPEQTAPARRRLLLIFEGKVTPKSDDPDEPLDRNACRPVAEFWASLTEKQGAERAEILRKFYFEGDMGGFGKLALPPISLENLGGSDRGQVRGNLFVEGEWQLREWLVRKHGNRLTFDVTTVKDNPLTEFYDKSKAATLLEPIRGVAELADFQKVFIAEMLPFLLSNNQVGSGDAVRTLSPEIQMMNGFGFGPGKTATFDEFQSTSQAASDIVVLDDAFKEKIAAAKSRLGSFLDVPHIVNRAMALTCHGCHQPEGATRPATPAPFRLEIAPATATSSAVFWPKTLNFVHISEKSELSEALVKSFLPFRAAVLKDELCRGPEAPVVADPQMAAVAARKASSFRSLRPSLRALREEAQQTESATQRAAIQEAINDEQGIRRRAERSLPGTYWPLRRTH